MSIVKRFLKRHIRSEIGFYIVLAIILVFCWLLLDRFPINVDLKSNLQANIIGIFFTALVIGRLLRIWYPPSAKTMSKFLIPQLYYCLFFYVRDLGFLLEYQFDNKGFKGITPIDLSTYGIFLKNNLSGLKQHLEARKDAVYKVKQLKSMNRMFGAFGNRIDQFIVRYGNHLDDGVLNSLYGIRHVCDYQVSYTGFITVTDPEEEVHMGEDITNERMREVLVLVEEIMAKIEEGVALKTEPLPI